MPLPYMSVHAFPTVLYHPDLVLGNIRAGKIANKKHWKNPYLSGKKTIFHEIETFICGKLAKTHGWRQVSEILFAFPLVVGDVLWYNIWTKNPKKVGDEYE